MFGIPQGAGEIVDIVEVGEVFRLQQRRGCRENRRAERCGGDAAQLRHRIDVVGAGGGTRTVPHFVVDDHQAKGLAAGRAELVFVDFAEQLALIEIDRAFQIAANFRPGDIHRLDLQLGALLHPIDQPSQSAPGTLKLAKAGIVQNGIELFRKNGVERGNVAVQCAAQRLHID